MKTVEEQAIWLASLNLTGAAASLLEWHGYSFADAYKIIFGKEWIATK